MRRTSHPGRRAQGAQRHGPWVDEDRLEVEQHEQHRNQVVVHAEGRSRIALGTTPHS